MLERRCNSEACIIAASKRSRTLDLPIANILQNAPREWRAHVLGDSKIRVARDINIDWKKFNPNDYLFVQSAIVCSINLASNGYYIEAPTDELVNNNGNAWSDEILKATFKTFIGKPNFCEHVQVLELSKGQIIDAVLRPVTYEGKTGKKANVLYCDILIAVDRKHTDIVSKIEAGELNAMSMGCLAHWVQCSRCGIALDDTMENCYHLKNQLMSYFKDNEGNERIVAELCGRITVGADGKLVADPKSQEFIEASWVERPAFQGAVISHLIMEEERKKNTKIVEMKTAELSELFFNMNRMRVADVSGQIVIRLAYEELVRRREGLKRIQAWKLK